MPAPQSPAPEAKKMSRGVAEQPRETSAEVTASPRSPRSLSLGLWGDSRVRADPLWRDKARAVVAHAQTFFAPLAIQLEVVDVANWDAAGKGAALDDLLQQLEQQPKGRADVIVGLVGDAVPLQPGPVESLGRTRFLGGDAIVARWDDPKRCGVVLAHELAHLFGAVHVADTTSLLHSTFHADARHIDSQSEAVIDAARNRRFDREAAPLAAEEASKVLRALEQILRDDRHNRDAEDQRTDLLEYQRTLAAEAQGAGSSAGDAARLIASGRAEQSRGAHGRALAYFREALRLCPRCPGAHLEIGRDLLDRGQGEDALAELAAEVKISSENADAHFLIGRCHEKAHRAAQARAAFETALRVDPNHPGAAEKLRLKR